ncbi:MAG: HlyD family efflux transporter periplasmic adaptor subunit [Lentisphaerota bacterium]
MRRSARRKQMWTIIIIMAIILAIAGYFTYKWYTSKPVTKTSKMLSDESPYSAFARGKIDVDGSIVKLSASKDGVLKDLLVDEGEKVKKGQILCKLDDLKEKLNWEYCKAEAELALKKIEPLKVTLDAAKREQKRSQNLIRQEAISRVKWDETNDLVERFEAEIKVAEAEAMVAVARQKQAEYDMEMKNIRAPADGRILRCDARPGYGISTLNVTVLFLFVPDAPFIVRAEVEEKFIKMIKPGVKVDIVPDSDESKTYAGKVLKMGTYLGPKRLSFDEPTEKSDVRTVECIITVYERDLVLGQRVLVKFKKPETTESGKK